MLFLKCWWKVVSARDLWQVNKTAKDVALLVTLTVVFANAVVEPGALPAPERTIF